MAVVFVFALTASVASSRVAGAGLVSGWTDKGLHVVGGPVAASGRVLVLTQGPGRTVWLESRSAKSGALQWKAPESFSEITAGESAIPESAGAVVLALTPAPGAGTAAVRLEGLDLTSGHVLWRAPRPVFVVDAPMACPEPLGAKAFCLVVAASSPGPTALVALAPRTGKTLAAVANVERGLGVGAGLYETIATDATAVEVSTPGGVVWSKSLTALFGKGYNPNYGWIFDQLGALQVGSIGKAPSGRSEDLSATETVAVSTRTGALRWREHGEFECGGITPLRVPYLCLMKGTATQVGATGMKTSPGATLTIVGFDPLTGRIAWRHPAGGLADVLVGKVAVVDDHSILVRSLSGRSEVLDLRTGHATTPAAGQTFWCSHLNVFHVASGMAGLRIGSFLYSRCDANGRAVASVPGGLGGAAAALTVGVRVGRLFVWAATDGLHAVAATR